jgi:hypothetical protein
MPPLATIEIPVARPFSPGRSSHVSKAKAAKRPLYRPRQYNNEPLPVKPSDQAPKNARIVNRTVDEDGVNYHLKIGDIDINDVKVEEILEYVSALDLENFENREFEAERAAMKVVEAEREREKQEKLERMKERARRKGIALSDSGAASEDGASGGEEAVGKHGRKRPDYSKFYMKNQPRKKGTLTISDNDDELAEDDTEESSAAEVSAPRANTHSPGPTSELQKRRRRKRDKVTGELLPLPGSAQEDLAQQKRPRRRRHPETGELMPLGWRYDAGEHTSRTHAQHSSPSFRKLSILDEPAAKRQRLDTESEMSRESTPAMTKAEIAAKYTPQRAIQQSPRKTVTPAKHPVVDLLTSESDDSEQDNVAGKRSTFKLLPKSPASNHKSNLMMQSAMRYATETSSEPEEPTVMPPSASTLRAKSPRKTSILNPSATRASSTDPYIHQSEPSAMEEDENEDEDEEWVVEGIQGHCLSDPASHPPEFGKKSIVLYQVKWENSDVLTWYASSNSFAHAHANRAMKREPSASFDDLDMIDEYRQQVGLDPVVSDEEGVDNVNISNSPRKGKGSQAKAPEPTDIEAEEETEYVVERIMNHHLSDARTHPAHLGMTPTMLYRFKWKGYQDPTWEPATSFTNKRMLREYNLRHRLDLGDNAGDSEDEDDEDEDMADAS